MAKAELSVLASEEALARRIQYERERRGWNTSKLARKLTEEAGCPINQSGVWKIENGEPRRKITVDEAIAFAKVFKIPLVELLDPPEVAAQRDVLDALTQIAETRKKFDHEAWELRHQYGHLRDLSDSSPVRAAARSAIVGLAKVNEALRQSTLKIQEAI